MSRPSRIGNILGVILPVAALIAAIVLLWNKWVGAETLAITALMYALAGGLGISVGFHRLFSHRSFDGPAPVRATFAILGSMAMQGPIIRWVANHRTHHAHPDKEGDPHSPHLSEHDGLRGTLEGLWHAHVGWIFTPDRPPEERYARDLLDDPLISFVDRTFMVWVLLGFALPFALGYAIGGTLEAALLAMLWGGAVRIFLVHHATFAVNSLCHFAGRRRFDTSDESRNLVWLAPLTFGEAWHNNHHAFPNSAFHGLRRHELDLGGLVIRGLERVKLVRNVTRISQERQQTKLERLAAGAQAEGQTH
jgi:stearoyl-CoA desaturase (delta-9 desaturase)